MSAWRRCTALSLLAVPVVAGLVGELAGPGLAAGRALLQMHAMLFRATAIVPPSRPFLPFVLPAFMLVNFPPLAGATSEEMPP